jgi:hypothetical protein
VNDSEVNQVDSDLEEEAKRVTEKQARATGRRLMDAAKESEDIIQCYRRIDGHLQRLAVSLDKMAGDVFTTFG